MRRRTVEHARAVAAEQSRVAALQIGAVLATENVNFNFVARIEDELVELWAEAKHIVGTSGRPKTVLQAVEGFFEPSEQDSMIFVPSDETPGQQPTEVLPSHEPQSVSLNAEDSPPATPAAATDEQGDPDPEVIPASDDAEELAAAPGEDTPDAEPQEIAVEQLDETGADAE